MHVVTNDSSKMRIARLILYTIDSSIETFRDGETLSNAVAVQRPFIILYSRTRTDQSIRVLCLFGAR